MQKAITGKLIRRVFSTQVDAATNLTMPSQLSDTVRKVEKNISSSETHGLLLGVRKDI
jgi:post-segregation antitoxin (ccd killing protein)